MLVLDAHGYRLTVAPEYGATMLTADWQHPDGRRVSLLAPLDQPGQGLKAGCFIMAPFANRIAAGRFEFEHATHQLPINRPEENVAIHGFSRDRSWQVLQADASLAVLADEAGTPAGQTGMPWCYRIEQRIQLSSTGIEIQLCLTNRGKHALPFGMGLHPWFPRSAGTTLAFSANGHFPRDADGLPAGSWQPHPQLGRGTPTLLAAWQGTDLCFLQWQPSLARINWPEQQTTLSLIGTGALRHLHVYLPRDRDVFCAEPVSHLPDAINRPGLGSLAAMSTLAPGERLAGGLTLSALALDEATGLAAATPCSSSSGHSGQLKAALENQHQRQQI